MDEDESGPLLSRLQVRRQEELIVEFHAVVGGEGNVGGRHVPVSGKAIGYLRDHPGLAAIGIQDPHGLGQRRPRHQDRHLVVRGQGRRVGFQSGPLGELLHLSSAGGDLVEVPAVDAVHVPGEV